MPVFHFLYFRHMRLLYFQKFTVYKIAQIQGTFSPVPTKSNLLRPCLAPRLPQPSFPLTTSCSLPVWIFPSRIPKGAFLWWKLILQPRPWVHPSGPLRSLSNFLLHLNPLDRAGLSLPSLSLSPTSLLPFTECALAAPTRWWPGLASASAALRRGGPSLSQGPIQPYPLAGTLKTGPQHIYNEPPPGATAWCWGHSGCRTSEEGPTWQSTEHPSAGDSGPAG